MMLAVAALLFQITPFAQALPVVTGVQAPTTSSAPAPTNAAPRTLVAGTDTTTTFPVSAAPIHPATEASTEPLHADAMNAPANDPLSAITVPSIEDGKAMQFVSVESLPSRKKWLILSLAEHGAAAFDAYATRDAVTHGAHEDNPFLAPVANSNAIYAVTQICPLLLDFATHKMQRSDNNFVRHTWWVPQSVGTVVYLFAGVHDLQVAH
ncbi:MAG: hypothetical protein WA175_00515 [Candidatus Acidiferrales bacterium]